MIRIQYNGPDNKVQTAVDHVNSMFGKKYFYDFIRQHQRFDMSNVPPGWIADLLETAEIKMTVEFYYSIHPFSKVLCYNDPKNPMVIHLNKWNINKPVNVICDAIVHQAVHAINALYPQYSFGHGDSSIEGKDNTAPCWIANLAQRVIFGDDTINVMSFKDESYGYPSLSIVV